MKEKVRKVQLAAGFELTIINKVAQCSTTAQLGSIEFKHDVRWNHFTQKKDGLFSLLNTSC